MSFKIYLFFFFSLIIIWVVVDFRNVKDLGIRFYCGIFNFEKIDIEDRLKLYAEDLKQKDSSFIQNTILIVGDSHVNSIKNILKNGRRWVVIAKGGETVFNYSSIMGKIPLRNFNKTIIHLGYNDLKYRSVNGILKIVKSVVLYQSQFSNKIILMSTFPVDERRWVTNKRIKKLNDGLKKICTEYVKLSYLDIYSELLSSKKIGLNKKYSLDGTHLNVLGNSALIKTIEEKIIAF